MCFPKFERWLEKEYPSVYEEEFLHRSDLPIGVLFAVFGFYPWILSNLTLGAFQIIGLAISIFGILLLLRAYVLHRLQLRQYSYHGLSRNTITGAIIIIDSKIVQQKELESSISYHGKSTGSGYIRGVKESTLTNFVKSTAGLIVWPSKFINEIKQDLEKRKRRLQFYTITFLVLLLISLFITYNTFASGEMTLISLFFILLAICSLEAIFFFFRFLFDFSYFFKD
ncbi:MAG: hypothetical protein E4H14_09920, partial [Candidatus Thorarchaeota archaeon]